MNPPRKALISVVGLACLLLAVSWSATPAAADNVTFQLSGSRAGGWGPTNTSLTTPGPHLTVVQGDNVTFNLVSADGFDHNWYIDYDGDASDDGNEPDSPDFNTAVTWNFTANRNGTFLYRSQFQADEPRMWGLITVLPPGSARPGLLSGDLTAVLVAVGVLIVVAVLAAAAVFSRRKKTPPPPPET